MSPYAFYLAAYFVLVVALAFAAYLLNVPAAWVVLGAILFIGAGVLYAAFRATPVEPATRPELRKDDSPRA